MKIHEYQAKGLFRDFGMPTPRGAICRSLESITICRAISGSALASRKTWQTPASCLITGMRDSSLTLRMRPGPPCGSRS